MIDEEKKKIHKGNKKPEIRKDILIHSDQPLYENFSEVKIQAIKSTKGEKDKRKEK